MFFARIYYEWKLHWKALLLAPLLLIIACSLFALLQLQMRENVGRSFLGFAEVFLPLSAGIMAGSMIVREPALELLLTLRHDYRAISLQRLLLIIFSYACFCCLVISIMATLHFWFLPRYLLSWPLLAQWLLAQLIWLVPLLWFVALSTCITLVVRSDIVSGSVLAALWISELLYWGPFHDLSWLRAFYTFPTVMWIYQGDAISIPAWYFNEFWLLPHLEQLAIALILFLASWFLFHNTERLLKGATIA
ncbi:hypothetical protein EPA93_37825 [Ktedonosporobacter rubrisoli]|uniref:Uncharacterized protein n=1 Tax=Ktedonosporobacter rubrisoli TaxID=2509675 RepID=A0A4P6K001_KTERU|nr:hypothetical protein [Ktedonosporobacter rubrisoli]QBD81427.1 hypothetical protein EPA93_37825 [Ktedonosporobacter rubrisoli]